MCETFLLSGITTKPIWGCQRRITWAAVFPCFMAISLMTGSEKRLLFPLPLSSQNFLTARPIPYHDAFSLIFIESFCVIFLVSAMIKAMAKTNDITSLIKEAQSMVTML